MVQQAKLGRADNEKRNCMATKTISCQECCLYGDVPPKGERLSEETSPKAI